ncbi:MAG: hypothetical protein ACC661_09235 [Verrucomicrobiales bacterium]
MLKSIAVLILLSCVFSALHLGGLLDPLFGLKGEEIDEAQLELDVVCDLNDKRRFSAANKALGRDQRLTSWLRQQLASVDSLEQLQADTLLQQLQQNLPEIAAASIYSVQASDRDDLFRQLVDWGRFAGDDYTHLAMTLVDDRSAWGIECLALLVEKLPRFTPALLSRKGAAFYNVCPLCGAVHLGKVSTVSRSILLECPKCGRPYDLLAIGMGAKYMRVNEFLTGTLPAGVEVPSSRRGTLGEVFAIWNDVLTTYRYVEDFEGINGRRDSWQTSSQTERYRNGDCEDTSILLADRLIARGFDARVALGRTSRLEGHSWCVVRVDGKEYILESTEATPDPANPPLTRMVGKRYIPEFLFDRDDIYFRNPRIPAGADYWSEEAWSAVRYGAETRGSLAAASGAK